VRTIEIEAIAPAYTAAAVFPLLSDFERYQEQCKAVRSVTFTEKNGNHSVSEWEVNFRQGIMRWTERDVFDLDGLAISFEQIEGDAKHFAGVWYLADTAAGCQIRFNAEFDMGVPSISDIIEPIAENALRENIESILQGLLGDGVRIV
jgi:ribosome-associated toxin RatA of RatAB toxin-antitoxin module